MTLSEYFKRLVDAFRQKDAAPSSALVLPTVPTGLSRRSFLGFMAAATVGAAVLDVEKLVWTPSTKTFFLPDAPALATAEEVAAFSGISSNSFPSPTWMAKEALRVLHNELVVTKQINRLYGLVPASKIGDTVQLRLPQQFGPVRRGGHDVPIRIDVPTRSVVLNQQIAANIDTAEFRDPRQAVNIAAHSIAALAKKKGVNICGELPLPLGMESAVVTKDGLSVRAVKYFDVHTRSHQIRIDLLGGKA